MCVLELEGVRADRANQIFQEAPEGGVAGRHGDPRAGKGGGAGGRIRESLQGVEHAGDHPGGRQRRQSLRRRQAGEMHGVAHRTGPSGDPIRHRSDGVVPDRQDQEVRSGKIALPAEGGCAEILGGACCGVRIPAQNSRRSMAGLPQRHGQRQAGPAGTDENEVRHR